VIPPEQQIERAALGALILNSAAIPDVRDWLSPSDFVHHPNGAIAEAVFDMASAGDHIDHVTVLQEMRRRAALDRQNTVGQTLTDVSSAETTPVPSQAVRYCRMVLEQSTRREIEAVGLRLQQVAVSAGQPDEVLALAKQQARELGGLQSRWRSAAGSPSTEPTPDVGISA
jgi:replicative DNA helicase